jgi:hypothetical protein
VSRDERWSPEDLEKAIPDMFAAAAADPPEGR